MRTTLQYVNLRCGFENGESKIMTKKFAAQLINVFIQLLVDSVAVDGKTKEIQADEINAYTYSYPVAFGKGKNISW